jgi:pimeloyl-ACP methyl ester carboxylesterase
MAGELADVRADDVVAAFGDLISEVDRKALIGGLADYLAESSRVSVSAGIDGWREDDLAFLADWGFPLDDLVVPVSIWQGDQDRMVPFAHGRWLSAHVAGAETHLMPGEGHLSIIDNFATIAADLFRVAERR